MKIQSKYPDQLVPLIFQSQLKALEENNKRTYPTPNSNYLNIVRNTPDVLGTYSDELLALRHIALEAFSLCLDIASDPKFVEFGIKKHPAIKQIVNYVIRQPWYTNMRKPTKAPVANEECDLPNL